MRVTPKISDNPTATKNRPEAVESPLSAWNRKPLTVMKAQGFDAKNGFELDAKAYPSISAFYAGFATGETDVLIGGPTILQKLYQEGVPVRIIGTGFTLADLVIFTKNDQIKSLADLKGKQLAADMITTLLPLSAKPLRCRAVWFGVILLRF